MYDDVGVMAAAADMIYAATKQSETELVLPPLVSIFCLLDKAIVCHTPCLLEIPCPPFVVVNSEELINFHRSYRRPVNQKVVPTSRSTRVTKHPFSSGGQGLGGPERGRHKEHSGRSQPPECLERVGTCCHPKLHPSGRRHQAAGACKPCTGAAWVDQAFNVDHISFRDILATIGTRLTWNGFLSVNVIEQTEDQAVKIWVIDASPQTPDLLNTYMCGNDLVETYMRAVSSLKPFYPCTLYCRTLNTLPTKFIINAAAPKGRFRIARRIRDTLGRLCIRCGIRCRCRGKRHTKPLGYRQPEVERTLL